MPQLLQRVCHLHLLLRLVCLCVLCFLSPTLPSFVFHLDCIFSATPSFSSVTDSICDSGMSCFASIVEMAMFSHVHVLAQTSAPPPPPRSFVQDSFDFFVPFSFDCTSHLPVFPCCCEVDAPPSSTTSSTTSLSERKGPPPPPPPRARGNSIAPPPPPRDHARPPAAHTIKAGSAPPPPPPPRALRSPFIFFCIHYSYFSFENSTFDT